LKNRDILILGAIILGGAVALELYQNFANPYIDYSPGSFTNLLIGSPQVFNYYKDGSIIGNYTYLLTQQTAAGQTLYTLKTGINAIYQGQGISLNTTHRFLGPTRHVDYSVNADIAGGASSVQCVFNGNAVGLNMTSQGKSQTLNLSLLPDTVLIDNNDPVHWELLMKSFTAQEGKAYNVNVLTPQGATVQTLQIGISTSHQFINIGGKSYECVVMTEPDLQISVFFFQGNMIQFQNDADGIMMVKRAP